MRREALRSFTTWRQAAYPALTYAFSIGSDRRRKADDFGQRIIGPSIAAGVVKPFDNTALLARK
jgi:hypothetical protein